MTPINTTPLTIEGATTFGYFGRPTEKEVRVYWTFLFVKRKRRSLNRHLTRGGIYSPYSMLSNEAMTHRHKWRIKRIKHNSRLDVYQLRNNIDYGWISPNLVERIQNNPKNCRNIKKYFAK
jgi:hypothetical protein